MFEKSGKFYADWRDKHGKRLRKSFSSARAALLFEREQKELSHPKKTAMRHPSPKFSSPDTTGVRRTAKSTQQSNSSSPQRGRLLLVNSARPTSLKSITRSKAPAMPTRPKQSGQGR
jgi:hypothetical protein